MLESLHIKGYRGFEDFEISGLERVNLIVGKNNSGKTSLLEAIQLYWSGGNIGVLSDILRRRSELSLDGQRGEIGHLFTGHPSTGGSAFDLAASPPLTERIRFGWSINELVRMKGVQPDGSWNIPEGLLALSAASACVVRFVSAASWSREDLVKILFEVAGTDGEDRALAILKKLEPRVVDIRVRDPITVWVRVNGSRVPLGSLGDGMWRLLTIAAALAVCRNGCLLIDEIDTGLHYSAMTDMWRMLVDGARDMNVQVFATTHNVECVYSLAEVPDESISLHRLEAGKSKPVRYSHEMIRVAAEREIEVR